MKFLILLIFISNSVYARWAVKSDLAYTTLLSKTEVFVNKDGTYKIHDSSTFQILKETGKDQFSLYTIPYNSETSSLKVLSAKVVNSNETINVDPSKIVDRAVAKKQGLDNLRQMQIVFPSIAIGSQVVIEYELKVTKIPVPGHFSLTTKMQGQGLLEQGHIEFISEIPLFAVKNDVFNSFTTEEKNENGKHYLKYTIREPVLQELVEETGTLPPEKYSFIKVSSEKDWTKISSSMKKGFDEVLNSRLPPELETLIKSIDRKQPTTEKVNQLVTYIVENFNYIGDWRTVKGGFAPKKISDITRDKYGDCKDFASLLTLLLRNIDIVADIALVHRSTPGYGRVQDIGLPSMDTFNHAIVRVQDGLNSYWVDPTNSASFGVDHREDIAGKHTLVLDGLHKLSFIPIKSQKLDTFTANKVVQFTGPDNGTVSVDIKLRGSSALIFTGMELQAPREKIEKIFLALTGQGESPILLEMSPVDFKSKKFKELDLNLKYSATKLSSSGETTRIASLPPIDMYLMPIFKDVSKWEGDLYIGQSMKMEKTTFLKGIFAETRTNGCSISTPWVDIKREFEYHPEGIKLHDYLAYKTSFISKESFHSTDFEILQYKMKECAGIRSVSFNFGSTKHNESGLEIQGQLAKLPTKERVEKRFEYTSAVLRGEIKAALSKDDLMRMLRQNIAENPHHVPSYQLLAKDISINGYLNGNNYTKSSKEEARLVLSQGLKANPGHPGLYISYLDNILNDQNKDAVKKGIDKIASLGTLKEFRDLILLGRVYNSLRDKDSALKALKNAQNMAKQNWQKERAWFNLAYVYSDFDMNEECIKAYDEVLVVNPKDSYTHINVIYCLLKAKKFDEAVDRSRKGLTVTNAGAMSYAASYALNTRAENHYSNKMYDLAEKDFTEALQYRNNPNAYRGLAFIAALHHKNFDKAFKLMDEGVKAYDGEPTKYMDRTREIFAGSTSHYVKFIEKIIDVTKDNSAKLWGLYHIGFRLHREKRRDELYAVMKRAIALGESYNKLHPNDKSLYYPLGSLYGLYGTDADNQEFLSKGKDFLVQAKALNPQDVGIDSHLNNIFRVQDLIKAGRVPASELNHNEKIK